MFNYMWRYAYNLRGIYETPVLPPASAEHDADLARIEEMIRVIRRSGRTLLTETESKQVLAGAIAEQAVREALLTTPAQLFENLKDPSLAVLHVGEKAAFDSGCFRRTWK